MPGLGGDGVERHERECGRGAVCGAYGSLAFGTFVTPTAQPVQHAVEQAIVADRAGLDLVTFQDHPYVAKFPETWTLIAYAAERTSASISPPTSPTCRHECPAQLARSVARCGRRSSSNTTWRRPTGPTMTRHDGRLGSRATSMASSSPAGWSDKSRSLRF